MVNPVKFINRATGLSSIFEKGQAQQTESVRQAGIDAQNQAATGSNAPPPQPAPLVGQESAPRKQSKGPRQFAPSIIGSGATTDSGSGGKTLLGQ